MRWTWITNVGDVTGAVERANAEYGTTEARLGAVLVPPKRRSTDDPKEPVRTDGSIAGVYIPKSSWIAWCTRHNNISEACAATWGEEMIEPFRTLILGGGIY